MSVGAGAKAPGFASPPTAAKTAASGTAGVAGRPFASPPVASGVASRARVGGGAAAGGLGSPTPAALPRTPSTSRMPPSGVGGGAAVASVGRTPSAARASLGGVRSTAPTPAGRQSTGVATRTGAGTGPTAPSKTPVLRKVGSAGGGLTAPPPTSASSDDGGFLSPIPTAASGNSSGGLSRSVSVDAGDDVHAPPAPTHDDVGDVAAVMDDAADEGADTVGDGADVPAPLPALAPPPPTPRSASLRSTSARRTTGAFKPSLPSLGGDEPPVMVAVRVRPLSMKEMGLAGLSAAGEASTAVPDPRSLPAHAVRNRCVEANPSLGLVQVYPTDVLPGHPGYEAQAASQLHREPLKFTFDRTFDIAASQASVYAAVGRPILRGIFDGFNGCILGYGA